MTSCPRDRRIALVTGASRELGAAVARRLAAAGTHVILAAQNGELLERVRVGIASAGGQATTQVVDLTDPTAANAIGCMVSKVWGRLDILIANAAVLGPMCALTEVDDAAWSETIETNLTANWRLLRAFDPLLHRAEAGRVVWITSSAASRLKPGLGPYAISKAALEALAKTYALETQGSRICVNLVDPGRMDTAMRTAAVQGEDRSALPQADEVAPLIVELAAASWTGTGQLIRFADWPVWKASGLHPQAPADKELRA